MLNGIDVSGIGQGASFDWAAWRGRIAFAFIKATEGTTFTDPDFARNWAAAGELGIRRGAYHIPHAGNSAAAEVDHLLSVADPQPGDLIMVDVEPASTDGLTVDDLAALNGAEADLLRAYLGAWPITYTDISMAQAGYVRQNGSCPLFLANPSQVKVPVPIGPWRLVSFEQTSQRGTDLDVFYGDAADLGRLAVAHARPKTSTTAAAPKPATLTSWRLEWTAADKAPELIEQASGDGGKTWS